jgi:hypothetical protein
MARTSQQWRCGEDLTARLQWHVHQALHQGLDCSILTFCLLATDPPAASAAEARLLPLAALAERLRPLVRASDPIEIEEYEVLGLVLPAAGHEDIHVVFSRLCDHLTAPPPHRDVMLRLALGFATVSQPDAGSCAAELALTAACEPRSVVSIAVAAKPPAGAPGPDARRTADRRRSRRATAEDADVDAPRTQAAPTIAGGRRRYLQVVSPARDSAERDPLRDQARALGVPYVQLPHQLPATCRESLSAELARELCAVPIGRSRNTLTVAMHNPRDAAAVLRLRAATGLSIFPVLAAPDELERALRQYASR